MPIFGLGFEQCRLRIGTNSLVPEVMQARYLGKANGYLPFSQEVSAVAEIPLTGVAIAVASSSRIAGQCFPVNSFDIHSVHFVGMVQKKSRKDC